MGFFGFVKKGVQAVVGGVKKAAQAAFDGVKKVVDFFIGGKTELEQTYSKSAEKVRNARSYNPTNATVRDTVDIYKLLEDIREDYKEKLNQYEKKIVEYSNEIKDFVVKNIDEELNQKSNYDSSNPNPFLQKEELEREFNKSFYMDLDINIGDIEVKVTQTIDKFKNFKDEILSHINIRECTKILKIKNGKEREEEMKRYIDGLIGNALNSFCDSIDEIAKNSLDAIKININRVMKNNEESIYNIKKEIEANKKLSSEEIEVKRKEYNRKEEVINSLLGTLENLK